MILWFALYLVGQGSLPSFLYLSFTDQILSAFRSQNWPETKCDDDDGCGGGTDGGGDKDQYRDIAPLACHESRNK